MCDATCESLWFEALFKWPPPPPPLLHASDGRRTFLAINKSGGKFQRKKGGKESRWARQVFIRPSGLPQDQQCAVKAQRILSRFSHAPSLPNLRGAAFKASVFKSVVKRFLVGLRNFEAEKRERRCHCGTPRKDIYLRGAAASISSAEFSSLLRATRVGGKGYNLLLRTLHWLWLE